MRVALSIVLVCTLGLHGEEKDELKKLEGSWDVVGIEAGGMAVPAGKGAPEKLTIKDGKMTGFGPEVSLSTDATKKPKWLNMTFTREGKEATINAIYELDGDELKICMPLAPKKGSGVAFENKRPEGFETKGKTEMVIKVKKAK
jgi:uncharacterized protein (TIGR03067 family)